MTPHEPKRPIPEPYEDDEDFAERMEEYRDRYEEYEVACDFEVDRQREERDE